MTIRNDGAVTAAYNLQGGGLGKRNGIRAKCGVTILTPGSPGAIVQDGKGDGFLKRPQAVVALAAGIVTIIGGTVAIVVAFRPGSGGPPDTAQAAISSCLAGHGLTNTREHEQISVSDGAAVYRGCSWPAPAGSDGDGFFQVAVIERPGPGNNQAEGMTTAQTFTSTCQHLRLNYRFLNQGTFVEDRPRDLAKGEILRVEDGSVWHPIDPDQAAIFELSVDQSMMMTNARYELDAVQCA